MQYLCELIIYTLLISLLLGFEVAINGTVEVLLYELLVVQLVFIFYSWVLDMLYASHKIIYFEHISIHSTHRLDMVDSIIVKAQRHISLILLDWWW